MESPTIQELRSNSKKTLPRVSWNLHHRQDNIAGWEEKEPNVAFKKKKTIFIHCIVIQKRAILYIG